MYVYTRTQSESYESYVNKHLFFHAVTDLTRPVLLEDVDQRAAKELPPPPGSRISRIVTEHLAGDDG